MADIIRPELTEKGKEALAVLKEIFPGATINHRAAENDSGNGLVFTIETGKPLDAVAFGSKIEELKQNPFGMPIVHRYAPILIEDKGKSFGSKGFEIAMGMSSSAERACQLIIDNKAALSEVVYKAEIEAALETKKGSGWSVQ